MKTTIDLPEDLVREMKLRAVQQGRKLREIAEETLRRGLAARPPTASNAQHKRVSLPIIPAPEGAPPFELDAARLLELESQAEQP